MQNASQININNNDVIIVVCKVLRVIITGVSWIIPVSSTEGVIGDGTLLLHHSKSSKKRDLSPWSPLLLLVVDQVGSKSDITIAS